MQKLLFDFAEREDGKYTYDGNHSANYKSGENNVVRGGRACLRAKGYDRGGNELNGRHVYDGKKYHRVRSTVPVALH